jgi:hypothetical protein
MSKVKLKFIEAIMTTLKIEQNPFTISAIDKKISFLNETDYSDFILELHNGKNNYKTAIEKISVTADNFKLKFERELAKDSETKAIELITKVRDIFIAVDFMIRKNRNNTKKRLTSKEIFKKINFHEARYKTTKLNIFSKNEIKILDEYGDITRWYSTHCNADGLKDERLVTHITQIIRSARVEFYMKNKNKIKLLGV